MRAGVAQRHSREYWKQFLIREEPCRALQLQGGPAGFLKLVLIDDTLRTWVTPYQDVWAFYREAHKFTMHSKLYCEDGSSGADPGPVAKKIPVFPKLLLVDHNLATQWSSSHVGDRRPLRGALPWNAW